MESIFPCYIFKYKGVIDELKKTKKYYRRHYNYFQSLILEKESEISMLEASNMIR